MLIFLKKTAIAVEALHQCGYGHFDIRLENCCYQWCVESGVESVKVVLIDVDNMFPLTSGPPPLLGSMGVMPKHGISDKNSLLDWKQFGLMGCCILEDKVLTHQQYHDPDYVFSAYNKFECFKHLIELGSH